MGKKATKKIVGHPELLPGEIVIDACWGAGHTMMKWGGIATLVSKPRLSTQEQRREVAGKGEGRAEAIASNGILALTDRRLLWCPVKTKLGKPEKIVGFEFDEIAEIRHDKPLLIVEFKDGSSGGIRSDLLERPGEFMKSYESRFGAAPG
jgi:hypothetical protein